MNQGITGFHQDESGDWVAELACGHYQHVRHSPPWANRPWVTTAEGRQSMTGHELACMKCDTGAPPDREQDPAPGLVKSANTGRNGLE